MPLRQPWDNVPLYKCVSLQDNVFIMPSLFWAIFAVLLFIIQFSTGVFDLVFLGLAALLVAGATALIPGFSGLIWLQVILFVLSSFGSLVVFRRRFKKLFRGDELLITSTEHAGQVAQVIEAIAPGQEGRISFHGTSWAATSHDETIPVGATVTILEKTDLVFYVTARPLDEPDSPGGALPRS